MISSINNSTLAYLGIGFYLFIDYERHRLKKVWHKEYVQNQRIVYDFINYTCSKGRKHGKKNIE